MGIHILKEEEWDSFIEESVLSLIQPTDGGASILALVGDLGVGKTTFSKKLLHTLGVKQHIQSPTFSIINSYDIEYKDFTKIFHIDVYRIDDLKELEILHIEDIFNNPKNIVVIEWADKIKKLIPSTATWIYFEHDMLETRKVEIKK